MAAQTGTGAATQESRPTGAGGFIRVAGEAPVVRALGETATLPAEGADTGGVLAAHEVVVAPGSANPPHLHRTYDEALYVLEGEVTLLVGDRSVTALAGTFGFAPRGTPHAVQNPGPVPARVLTVTVPADDVRALVEALNALPPGPPDMTGIGAILVGHDIHPAGPAPGRSGAPR
jgi:mannose-6-phosphate isomerase-like protein (cupin superfamily)